MGRFRSWVIRGVALVSAALLVVVGVQLLREVDRLPEAEPGPAGDELARRMTAAVGLEAWERTGAVQWGFAGNEHLWDRQRQLARYRRGDVEVLTDLTNRQGRAWRGGNELVGRERDGLLETAYAAWINDGFWLAAPMKAFDDGTVRSAVEVDGAPGVLVQYTRGGLTPGDSYLWVLGTDGRPVAWRMWVSVIPIPGVDVTWEDWVDIGTGAWLATTRRFTKWGVALHLDDVRGGATVGDLVHGDDPFAPLSLD